MPGCSMSQVQREQTNHRFNCVTSDYIVCTLDKVQRDCSPNHMKNATVLRTQSPNGSKFIEPHVHWTFFFQFFGIFIHPVCLWEDGLLPSTQRQEPSRPAFFPPGPEKLQSLFGLCSMRSTWLSRFHSCKLQFYPISLCCQVPKWQQYTVYWSIYLSSTSGLLKTLLAHVLKRDFI